MTKIQENRGQKMIGIPKEIAKETKLKKGEEVTVLPDEKSKNIIIKRRKKIR